MDDGALFSLPPAQPRQVVVPGVVNPVARVVVNTNLPQLWQVFDYEIPAALSEEALPGSLVTVKVSRNNLPGVILERTDTTAYQSKLAPIKSVDSLIPPLTPEIRSLLEKTSENFASHICEMLRFALPARAVSAEKHFLPLLDSPAPFPRFHLPDFAPAGWLDYQAGEAFIRRLSEGESPRAVATVLPPNEGAASGADLIVSAVAACLASQRRALILVPDVEIASRVRQSLADAIPELQISFISGNLTPAPRYREFLAARCGQAQVVIGARSAVFTPLPDLGLIVCWDDIDTRYREHKHPYYHAREVAAFRAHLENAGMLILGPSVSVDAYRLVDTGFAAALRPPRELLRQRCPIVRALDQTDMDRSGPGFGSRIPGPAIKLLRQAVETGPVLVVTPFSGYLSALQCQRCHAPARCSKCGGPLHGSLSKPLCRWCGAIETDFTCAECAGRRIRIGRIEAGRITEELGRAFPMIPILISTSVEGVIPEVDGSPRVIVATPGAEPRARGGYAGGVVLDASTQTNRPEMWAPSKALHDWLKSASLLRAGATFMISPGAISRVVQAAVRWDPWFWAGQDYDERRELQFSPAVPLGAITAQPSAIEEASEFFATNYPQVSVLGPVEIDEKLSRIIVRSESISRAELGKMLLRLQRVFSSRHLFFERLEINPEDLW